MARKSEVYTWRVSPALKAGLEEAAREERKSVAQLLDQAVAEHLGSRGRRAKQNTERRRQILLHQRVDALAGRIRGGDPRRAERVRELVRARLRRPGRAR